MKNTPPLVSLWRFKNFPRRISKIFLFLFLFLLYACFHAEKAVSEESEALSIQAFILGEKNRPLKDTLIGVGDTIRLYSNVFPEVGVNAQSYFWSLEGKRIVPEFTWKASFSAPGIYEPKFTLVDFHGDSLSDSVRIHVSSAPLLDTLLCIPADGAQKLPIDSIAFSFSGKDQDGDKIFYSFSLRCGENFSLDTLLETSSFLLRSKLPFLEKCTWKVSVQDEFGISGNSITASFTTRDSASSGRFSGRLFVYPDSLLSQARLQLFQVDKNSNDSVLIKTLDNQNGFFDSEKLAAGSYILKADIPSYSDYGEASLDFNIRADVYRTDLVLRLYDEIAPTFLDSLPDTLRFQETFALPLKNGGIPLTTENQQTILDGKLLQSFISNDTLYIPMPPYSLPTIRFLSIKIEDFAGNKLLEHFVIAPAAPWGFFPQNATISSGENFSFVYTDNNPYGLSFKTLRLEGESLDSLFKISLDDSEENPEDPNSTILRDVSKDEKKEESEDEEKSKEEWLESLVNCEENSQGRCTVSIPAEKFPVGAYEFLICVFYTNGLELSYPISLEIIE